MTTSVLVYGTKLLHYTKDDDDYEWPEDDNSTYGSEY